MTLRFANTAKELKVAANAGSFQPLKTLYGSSAELIYEALLILLQADNLNDVMFFQKFRPHALKGESKGKFSMSVGGRKRLIVMTRDSKGKTTKEIDFSASYGLIVEVSEHYGD